VSRLPRFDGERLRRRRIELGIAEDTLARSLGVTPTTLRHMEGANSANHDLRFLTLYAERLGLHFTDLFQAPDDAPTDGGPVEVDDARRVGAALVAAGGELHADTLAEVLEWSPERARLAFDGLDRALRACGMRVVWSGDAQVLLAAEDGEADTVARHVREHTRATGLKRADAVVLARLLDGPQTHTGTSRVSLRRLVAAGIAVNERKVRTHKLGAPRVEIAVTDQARYDLYLTDTPPGPQGATADEPVDADSVDRPRPATRRTKR